MHQTAQKMHSSLAGDWFRTIRIALVYHRCYMGDEPFHSARNVSSASHHLGRRFSGYFDSSHAVHKSRPSVSRGGRATRHGTDTGLTCFLFCDSL